MIIKVTTAEKVRAEQQERELALQQAFQNGQHQACMEIIRALMPVSNEIAETALQDFSRMSGIVLHLTSPSVSTLAAHLAKSLENLTHFAQLYLNVINDLTALKAEQSRLQQALRLAQHEATQTQHIQKQLNQSQARISTLETSRANLELEINRLESEIERQHTVIVELHERLKPGRPSPQKQKSG